MNRNLSELKSGSDAPLLHTAGDFLLYHDISIYFYYDYKRDFVSLNSC